MNDRFYKILSMGILHVRFTYQTQRFEACRNVDKNTL